MEFIQLSIRVLAHLPMVAAVWAPLQWDPRGNDSMAGT
jgi:hypothetical protein